jgi:hypothetical protein
MDTLPLPEIRDPVPDVPEDVHVLLDDEHDRVLPERDACGGPRPEVTIFIPRSQGDDLWPPSARNASAI